MDVVSAYIQIKMILIKHVEHREQHEDLLRCWERGSARTTISVSNKYSEGHYTRTTFHKSIEKLELRICCFSQITFIFIYAPYSLKKLGITARRAWGRIEVRVTTPIHVAATLNCHPAPI